MQDNYKWHVHPHLSPLFCRETALGIHKSFTQCYAWWHPEVRITTSHLNTENSIQLFTGAILNYSTTKSLMAARVLLKVPSYGEVKHLQVVEWHHVIWQPLLWVGSLPCGKSPYSAISRPYAKSTTLLPLILQFKQFYHEKYKVFIALQLANSHICLSLMLFEQGKMFATADSLPSQKLPLP